MLDHVLVWLSIIYGVVATQFLNGWKDVFVNSRHTKPSTIHLAWSALAFSLLVENWWALLLFEKPLSTSVLAFIGKLTHPLLFFVVSSAMFASDLLPRT